MKKKIIAFFLCLLIACSASFTVFAKTYILSEDFKAAVNDDGTLELAGYEGSKTEIEAPEQIYGAKITSVEERAFADNTQIKKITLPKSVTEIKDSAFYNASQLEEIVFKGALKKLGSNAFYNCPKLKKIDLGSSLTEISGYAFNRCSSLVVVKIPKSVTKIGDYAFFKCSSLERVEIPSTVTQIDDTAFDECNKLTIVGDRGSAAEEYAKKFSVPFETFSGEQITDPPSPQRLLGDADGNGTVNEDGRDYIEFENADVNADGKLSVKDSTLIQRYIKYGKF